MSILLTSAGRRVELIRAFKRAQAELGSRGRVIAVDIDPLAPALHDADCSYVVPPTSDPGYVDALLAVCRKEGVKLVFPMIDPDIPVLARHRDAFESAGARAVVAPEEAVMTGADKWRTFEFFKHNGIPTPHTCLPDSIDTKELPVFVKPRYGSASQDTFVARDTDQLRFFLGYVQDPIVQDYIQGVEITSDVICDFDGNVLSVVSRRRLTTRSGEVSRGITVRDERIERDCVEIARKLKAIGPLNVQCFVSGDDLSFTEVNLRFGGGSPLAIAAGADFPKWLIALADNGAVEIPPLGSYQLGLYLTRFDDSFFLSQTEFERVACNRL